MLNLHIIGAQKCGTSALAHFLHQHKEIYVLDGKEAHIFDHPAFLASQDKMAYAKEKIRQRMLQASGESYICDATPITCYRPEFLHHCYQFNPKAKFIMILRNPVERALSHYRMNLARGREHASMLKAFVCEHMRLSKNRGNWGLSSPLRDHSYLRRGRYTQQLEQVFKIVPAKQVLVLYQDELKSRHHETLAKVFEFLELEAQAIPAQKVFEGENNPYANSWIARFYAKCYFSLLSENKETWQRLINQANKD